MFVKFIAILCFILQVTGIYVALVLGIRTGILYCISKYFYDNED